MIIALRDCHDRPSARFIPLLAFAEWEEWINLLLGVWVAVSAWAVGFAVHATATWVHVVTGIIVAVVAGLRLWFMHRTPPRVSA